MAAEAIEGDADPELLSGALRLLTAPADTLDRELTAFLEHTASLQGAPRAVVFLYDEEGRVAEATWEWRQPELPSLLGGQYIESELSDAIAALRAGRVLALVADPTKHDFPGLRAVMDAQHSEAGLLLPVTVEGRLHAVLVFEYRAAMLSFDAAVLKRGERIARIVEAALARRREQQVAAENQARVLERQKLETLGVMAGGIAHDFNNVLQGVLGLSELIVHELPEGPARDISREIATQVSHAADLTHRLLAFSRQEVRQRKRLDVAKEIGSAVRLLSKSIPEDRVLSFQPEVSEAFVYMSPIDLQQAFINVCNNAAAAMPQGGTITIGCRYGNANRETIEISVRDTGVGMDDEHLRRATIPFFTTKPPGEGTGLGLAMVKHTVEGAGGRLELTSELDKGTMVRIILPNYRGRDASASVEALAPVTGSETLLVVEDDAIVRRVTASHLRRAGFKVLEAMNGDQALRLYEERVDRVDLIITDVVMPVLGGVQLVQVIAQRGEPPPVLFATGYDAGKLSDDLLHHPFRDLIEKPYKATDLLRRVRRLLDAAQRPSA